MGNYADLLSPGYCGDLNFHRNISIIDLSSRNITHVRVIHQSFIVKEAGKIGLSQKLENDENLQTWLSSAPLGNR